MDFLHAERDRLLELAVDDVFIVPRYYDGTSRLEVDLRPKDFAGGSHPIVAANMSAVTGKRMAETVARYGGLGVLPQDMDLGTVERIVGHIKNAHSRFDTPLSVTPQASLRDVQGIIRKRSHDMVIVVDPDNCPLGLITHADLRDQDQYTPASQLMNRQVVSLPTDVTNKDAFDMITDQRVKAAPVVTPDGRLFGIVTRDDAVRLEILKPALDTNDKLMVAAAIGISSDAATHAAQLVAMGVDVLVLDTAHGHQRRMLDAIRAVQDATGGAVPLVAGNVCTPQGVDDLCEAGADVVKVNVGPGAMCTTRMQTGVGRPTFSAAYTCASAARAHGKHIWADGGVRNARDVALYLAAGASRVMVGTMLAGTYESPGDIREDREGYLYKENFGMASARAVRTRSANLDLFEQAKKEFFREGISSSRIYIRPGRESVGAILIDIITGVQSAMTYTGAVNCDEFHDKVLIGVQSASGYTEGQAHGRIRR